VILFITCDRSIGEADFAEGMPLSALRRHCIGAERDVAATPAAASRGFHARMIPCSQSPLLFGWYRSRMYHIGSGSDSGVKSRALHTGGLLMRNTDGRCRERSPGYAGSARHAMLVDLFDGGAGQAQVESAYGTHTATA